MNEEFNHVALLLEESLCDEPEQLIRDLEDVEMWNSRMQFLLAEVNSNLDRENFRLLPTEGTELQKKTALKFFVSDLQQQKDKIEAIVDAIKTRITLGQSILKYYSSTQSIQYKQDNTKSLKDILGD